MINSPKNVVFGVVVDDIFVVVLSLLTGATARMPLTQLLVRSS